jgi:hypothetical protein
LRRRGDQTVQVTQRLGFEPRIFTDDQHARPGER